MMTSPYHRAKAPATFEIPEVRDELLYAQRLLYRLCQHEQTHQQELAEATQLKFTELARTGFKESLHDLAEDVHAACDWAIARRGRYDNLIKAAVLFAGALIAKNDSATALPLLKKLSQATGENREIKAICSINCAVAFAAYRQDASLTHWENAIFEMPLARWMHYPSLAQGCHNLIRKLRIHHDKHGDLQSLLAAGQLAERAHAALTHFVTKGTPFERSGEAVKLLVEVAKVQQATSIHGFAPLEIPEATKLMELAVINAAANTDDRSLFTTALTFLAQHYSTCGLTEKARDTAAQAIFEYSQGPQRDPYMLKLLQHILATDAE